MLLLDMMWTAAVSNTDLPEETDCLQTRVVSHTTVILYHLSVVKATDLGAGELGF